MNAVSQYFLDAIEVQFVEFALVQLCILGLSSMYSNLSNALYWKGSLELDL